MKLFDRFKDNEDLADEIGQLRKKVKFTSKEYFAMENSRDEYRDKYEKLLEEKSEKFDRYLYYYDLYAEATEKIKNFKKENAKMNTEGRKKDDFIEELQEEIDRKDREIGRLKKKVDKLMEKEKE